MNAELQFLTALQGLHTPARDAVMLFFTRLGNAGDRAMLARFLR